MTLNIQHLNKTIGKQQILKDINLTIQEGEIVGLLGPNGAGKSSLMKCITGLWSIDSGTIEVCSKEKIGYLPELNPLYDEMYVREYLYFMAELSATKHISKRQLRENVNEVIERVGLSPEIKKKIGKLSKGYRQRVGLAQAILHKPQLLILDEPTNGFDPEQLIEIRNLFLELGQSCTILLSTHIMQEVEAVCTRAVILSHGEIKADFPDIRSVNLTEEFHRLVQS